MTADVKEKALGKELVWTMLFCFIAGLISILFSSCIYWYWGELQLQAGDEFIQALIYEHNLAITGILAFGVLPIMGFAFFGIGYKLWKCNRQSKLHE
jgi:hypothetical protein